MDIEFPKARLIAFYLPQFHPIQENDMWWGKGFTEWTNVGKARPLFKGHYQPRVPADLGYYDLRIAEVREEQAKLARYAGIEGFCYWHYWFGKGKRLLEKVFNEVVRTKEPDFPFCLGWANESWSGVWHGLSNRILIEQQYPGLKDYELHFYKMLPAFLDKRYIKVDSKPLFYIYKPLKLPNSQEFIDLWQELAIKNGLNGFHFVGQAVLESEVKIILDKGFDACNINRLSFSYLNQIPRLKRMFNKILQLPNVYLYENAVQNLVTTYEKQIDIIPNIVPNWDHSPRSGNKGIILHGSSPEIYRKHIQHVLSIIKDKPFERKIAFVKSWNEWGEGNYLEPDIMHGRKYLEVMNEILCRRVSI